MKLTEEQVLAADLALAKVVSDPDLRGVEQARRLLEMLLEIVPHGIQWRDLRECKPMETAEYLVMHRKYDVCICAWTKGEGFGIDGLMITHWAYINLPQNETEQP